MQTKKCTYYEVQTRSADESMTIFITCLTCGKDGKINILLFLFFYFIYTYVEFII